MSISLAAVLAASAALTPVAGPTFTYDAAFADARTSVEVVDLGLATAFHLKVTDFPADAAGRTFGAHLHTSPCGLSADHAGPHLQHNVGLTLADRELWIDVTVGADGTGEATALRLWRLPAAPRSLVIHAAPTDPATGKAGSRILCTTLPA